MMEWITGAALLLLLLIVLLNIFGLMDVLELVAGIVSLLTALVALVLAGFTWIVRKATRMINSKGSDDHKPNGQPPG